MKSINTLLLIIVITLAGAFSCKKDKTTASSEPMPAAETGSLKIEMEHLVGNQSLAFDVNYINYNRDTFKVSKFNYIISNVVLTKSDGSTFSEAESYHLVKHAVAGSNLITVNGVPHGTYIAIKFTLGVDSARNTSGARTGALDPGNDMYWSWSSGYIFLKLEGTSPQSGDKAKKITYHIGGFGGPNKTQRNFSFAFGSETANVSTNVTPIVHFGVDVNELFESPNVVSFATKYNQTDAGLNAKYYADNYANMISFKHVHN